MNQDAISSSKPRGGIPRLRPPAIPFLSYGFRPFFLGAALWAFVAMILWIGVLSGWWTFATKYGAIAWHAHDFLFGYIRQVVLEKPDGRPYEYLSSLPRALGSPSRHLLFAANGGMYHSDNSPVGLYIEDDRELVRANTSAGPGNFHMRPNGVFYLAGEVAGFLETRSFIKQNPQVDFATQSGPMMVIDGEVNARFMRYGGSRKYRVGVGSRNRNSVVFAISESEVSFGEFARLFLGPADCRVML